MVVFKLRTSLFVNTDDLIWYIVFVSSTLFVFLFIPYNIPWYASGFALISWFRVILAFPGRWYSYGGNSLWFYTSLSALHPGVCRVLSPTCYYVVSPSFGRCLVFPVRSLEDRVPLKVSYPSDISSFDFLQKRKYTGGWGMVQVHWTVWNGYFLLKRKYTEGWGMVEVHWTVWNGWFMFLCYSGCGLGLTSFPSLRWRYYA